MAKKAKKKSAKSAQETQNRQLAQNRKAKHEYEIIETIETGMELLGTEVKSIRAGKVNLKDGFCLIKEGQLQLHNVHISPHKHASNYFNHDPLRIKKLLAHRREINKLKGLLEKKGLALIPLNLHIKGSWIKLTIGVGKGKKLHDKREHQKAKEVNREMDRALKRF